LIRSLIKKISFSFLVMVCLLPLGCREVEYDLVLNQDGSGTLDGQYVLEKLFLKAAGVENPEIEDVVKKGIYLSEQGLHNQFQGDGVEIANSFFEWNNEALHGSFTLRFESFSDLLSTPAFQNDAMRFYRNDSGNLAFRINVHEIAGATAETRTLVEHLPDTFEGTVRITLPSMVLENNADSIEDTILTWRYTKSKLTPEVMTAVCEGAGLAFLATLPVGEHGRSGDLYVYTPIGKPDPFKPFIYESRPTEDSELILNPLQRYHVSQLKLVGIIWNTKNPTAMMEDASGKGFIVSIGTPIGRNDGVVTDITEEEVIIEEKTVNLLGETKTREVKVVLHQEERKGK